jgi:hypothetical protein
MSALDTDDLGHILLALALERRGSWDDATMSQMHQVKQHSAMCRHAIIFVLWSEVAVDRECGYANTNNLQIICTVSTPVAHVVERTRPCSTLFYHVLLSVHTHLRVDGYTNIDLLLWSTRIVLPQSWSFPSPHLAHSQRRSSIAARTRIAVFIAVHEQVFMVVDQTPLNSSAAELLQQLAFQHRGMCCACLQMCSACIRKHVCVCVCV